MYCCLCNRHFGLSGMLSIHTLVQIFPNLSQAQQAPSKQTPHWNHFVTHTHTHTQRIQFNSWIIQNFPLHLLVSPLILLEEPFRTTKPTVFAVCSGLGPVFSRHWHSVLLTSCFNSLKCPWLGVRVLKMWSVSWTTHNGKSHKYSDTHYSDWYETRKPDAISVSC